MKKQEEFTAYSDYAQRSPQCQEVLLNQRCLSMDEKLRKLTEKEMWRLMGFTDDDYAKCAEFQSKTTLKKQAGNSIVVKVLEAIFKEIMED